MSEEQAAKEAAAKAEAAKATEAGAGSGSQDGAGAGGAGSAGSQAAGGEQGAGDDKQSQAKTKDGLFDENGTKAGDGAGDAGGDKGTQEIKYDLKFPENVPLDEQDKSEFVELMKKSGFNNEQAQALVDYQSKINAKYAKTVESEHANTIEGWKKTIKTQYGADYETKIAAGKKALETYFSPESIALLGDKGSGLGNHPSIAADLIKLGESLMEDKSVQGGKAAGGAAKSAADKLFPNM